LVGGGGEIKNLGPLPYGAPSKIFLQKPKNFAGKYWGGRRSQKCFQTLGLHNGDLRLHYMMKTLISSFFTFLLIYIQGLEIS
jgi:hypothetical protein